MAKMMNSPKRVLLSRDRRAYGNRLRNAFIGLAISAVLAFSSGSAHAEDDPVVLLDRIIQSALSEFLASKDELQNDTSALIELLDRTIVPLFDFERITRLVLAKHWKKATQEERDAFSVEFKRLMIATYSSALFKYSGEQEVKILGADIKEKKQRQLATVRTELVLGDGSNPVPIEYFMIRIDDGAPWKIYNIAVAGLNMVINYRGVFQSTILDKGLEGTIDSMRRNNDRFIAS